MRLRSLCRGRGLRARGRTRGRPRSSLPATSSRGRASWLRRRIRSCSRRRRRGRRGRPRRRTAWRRCVPGVRRPAALRAAGIATRSRGRCAARLRSRYRRRSRARCVPRPASCTPLGQCGLFAPEGRSWLPTIVEAVPEFILRSIAAMNVVHVIGDLGDQADVRAAGDPRSTGTRADLAPDYLMTKTLLWLAVWWMSSMHLAAISTALANRRSCPCPRCRCRWSWSGDHVQPFLAVLGSPSLVDRCCCKHGR